MTTLVAIDGQYRALREEAGVAIRAGSFAAVVGPDAGEYLQGQLTQDVESLEPGRGAYAALLDRKGRMQADMRVFKDADGFLLVLEQEPLAIVLRHLTMYSVGRDVSVADRSDELALISIAGPAAAELTGLAPLSREHDHAAASLDGIELRSVRTHAGLDLIVPADASDDTLDALERRGVAPVSEEALEILRVESGRPRFGREMTQQTIPQEAGINERAVSFTKGCYIGQETVARLHYKGKPNRHLRGLRLAHPVAAGSAVTLGERELGKVGTSVLSPAHGAIALAVLRREAGPGAEVLVGGEVTGEVVELPFDGCGVTGDLSVE